MFHKLFAFFFPDRCILCGQPLSGGAVCEHCVDKLTLCRDIHICKKCSRPIDENQLFCTNCAVTPHYFTICFAAAVYEGEMRRSILKYKFYHHPEYYRGYARLIYAHLLSFDMLPHFDMIAAAPLSDARQKERGYNQAELIGKELARLMNLPFCKNCVRKIRHTNAQSTLSYRERRKNLENTFRAERTETICGKTVLLVDDVFTTGTTADEITKQLLKSGAKQVYVAVVAVTPLKDLAT